MQFRSNIIIHPGLGNSGPQHWQSLWETQFNFGRIEQQDWDTPACDDWIEMLNNAISYTDEANTILVGHSLACSTIAYWAKKFDRKIKAALLVAPSDTEADNYPRGTTGFKPMPLLKLPFPTIVVASTNDYYVTFERAQQLAQAWGSELINVGDTGHINVGSGFGEWNEGLAILQRLDSL